jgi:hypothetical protein
MRFRIQILSLVIAAVIVGFFMLAPVVYGWHRTTPPGVDVTFYESPTCYMLGYGAVYSYGHSLGGNGQTVSVHNYQIIFSTCDSIPLAV